MEYSTRLPAAHLGDDALRLLEDCLLRDCTTPDIAIEVIYDSVTYSYSSLQAVCEDSTLPSIVRRFSVTLSSQEGDLELVADDRDGEFRLALSGERPWVETKRDGVESFFARHGAVLRTYLERYLGVGLAALAVATGLGLHYSGLGGLIGMQAPVDALLYGSLALVVGGILHLLLGAVYPYVALVPTSRVRSAFLYLRK